MNEKPLTILLTLGLIKKILLYKMSYFPEPHNHSKKKIETELDFSNYASKSDLKNATGVETSNLARLKSVTTNTTNTTTNTSNSVKLVKLIWLTMTQKLMKLKRKFMIMIVVNILLLENETADNFIARLKQANLGSKNGIAFVKNRF